MDPREYLCACGQMAASRDELKQHSKKEPLLCDGCGLWTVDPYAVCEKQVGDEMVGLCGPCRHEQAGN